jgi:hypothetical protein
MASVRSEPISRPSTPRVDVAAILAGAQAHREKCREAKVAAQVYRWQPRRAWPEPEPEPEPSAAATVTSEEESDDEPWRSSSNSGRGSSGGAAEWTESKSSELAAFDPLAAGKSASPPSADRPSRDGSPGGRGRRRVEHAATRQLSGSRGKKPGSRGRRRIDQARAYAESGELDGSPQRQDESKMAALPLDDDEGLSDSEYTDVDLDEIASTQAHLQRGFEDLMAECDLMLQTNSGAAELESLQGAVSAVAHRLQTLDVASSDVADDVDLDMPSDTAAAGRGGRSSSSGGSSGGSSSRSRSKGRSSSRGGGKEKSGGGEGLSEARRKELEAELERELDEELEATQEAMAAGLQRRQRMQQHGKSSSGGGGGHERSDSVSSSYSGGGSDAGSDFGGGGGGSELGSARRKVATKAKGAKAFSTSAAASHRKPPRR